MDFVVRGGRIVTAAVDTVADIGLRRPNRPDRRRDQRVIDARGRLVLPGCVDAPVRGPHEACFVGWVHLSSPPGRRQADLHRWVDDFASGSAAALAGGVTTLGNMTFLGPGEGLLAGMERVAATAAEQTIADLFFHPVVDDPRQEVLDEIPDLLDAGCRSIKFFMVGARFDAQVGAYVEATRRAGASGLITLIHCEDAALIADATAQLVAAGKTSLRHYAASRPVVAEVVATQRAIAMAEATGAPVYLVHVSCEGARGVRGGAVARHSGVRGDQAALPASDRRALAGAGWREVCRTATAAGAVRRGGALGRNPAGCGAHRVHRPRALVAGGQARPFTIDHPAEAENLQTMLPMLYSEGVRTGRISLGRMVEVTSTNAARLFGLYPRKGTIAVGSDADLVVFDPERSLEVTGSMLKSNADYSVYEGSVVTGWPELTLRRGEVVYRNDLVVGQPGSGELLGRIRTEETR